MSLKKVLQWYSPLPSEGIRETINRKSDDPELEAFKNRMMLRHSGKNLVAWGTTLFAMKLLLDQAGKFKKKKSDKELRKYINAKYPIVSLDPNLDDTLDEKAEREIGLEKMSSGAWEEFKSFFKSVGRQDRANLHLAATIMSSVGGAIGGYKIADKLISRREQNELRNKIDTNKNEMDKLMYEEYMRTRGLNKESRDKNVKWGVGTAAFNMWLVWATMSLALAYSGSKRYFDKEDPKRQRMKELMDIAKEQSKIKETPMLINETTFNPTSAASLKPGKDSIKGRVFLPKKEKAKESIDVDTRDPYADVLG
jgi:hypothetical protein